MRLVGLVLLLTLSLQGFSQRKATPNTTSTPNIRQYWLVLLTAGPHRDQDSVTAAQIQSAHLANIKRLYEEGKLKVAGPFGEEGNWQGLFIFDCPTKEEVEQLLKTDKAVASGRLNYEIHSWYTAPAGSFTPGKPKKLQ